MQTEKYPKNDRKHQRKRGKKFLNVRRILFRRRQDKAAELPRRHAEIFRRQKKTAERRKQKRHWYAAHPATFFFGGKKKGKCGIAVRHNACINSQEDFIRFAALTEADEEVYCAGEWRTTSRICRPFPFALPTDLLREPCPMSSDLRPAATSSLFADALCCERRQGRLHLRLDLLPQGRDWLALLHGGAAHIGATAQCSQSGLCE